MKRLAALLALGALFTGGAFAASNVPQLANALEQTTSTATTATGTTATGTTATGTTATGTTATGTTATGTTATGTTATGTTSTQTTPTTTASKAHKVIVCHKGRQIEIAKAALPAHKAHGDNEGACAAQATSTPTTTQAVTTQQQPAAKAKQPKAKHPKAKKPKAKKQKISPAKAGKDAKPRGNSGQAKNGGKGGGK